MDCIFCKIIAGQIPAKLLQETIHSISFLDAFPLARGHTLVIPKKHHKRIQDLSIEENTDLFTLVHEIITKLDAVTSSALLAVHNGEEAGQEVPHVHVHLVPRHDGDSAGAIHSMFDSIELSESEMSSLHEKLKA